jgi:mRNA interferase RelE/StbE
MLIGIADRRIREKLAEVIDRLESDPELRGKPLDDDLAGYRSVRAVGQRYRIIYRVERTIVTVVVVAAGIRNVGGREDIYRVAAKLVRLGLL